MFDHFLDHPGAVVYFRGQPVGTVPSIVYAGQSVVSGAMSVHEVDTEQLAHILTVIDPELAANVRAAQLAAWGALKADPDESLEPDLSQVTLDPFIIREV